MMANQASEHLPLNFFPCGLVVTTIDERKIVSANQYFYVLFEQSPDVDTFIGGAFTAASKIMIESYVMPMLHSQNKCNEIQLTIKTDAGKRIPVLVNARVLRQQRALIYWSITAATQRDNLYQELVNLRNQLESKAEKLEALAETDELTGLANRRAFIKQGQVISKQATRMDVPCAFLMIDIDDFKHVNDEHGHAVGDDVLRELGERFRANCRETDMVARMGGEEFAIVTICQTFSDAQKFAQKLIHAVRGKPFSGLNITISVGLAVATRMSLEQLFKHADTQLYQAKENGKNQCSGQFIGT